MKGSVLQSRPRFSIEETEQLVKMLENSTTTHLAAAILGCGDQIIPWRYVRQVREVCRHAPGAAWLSVHERNAIHASQFNKRSRIEKKKIHAQDEDTYQR